MTVAIGWDNAVVAGVSLTMRTGTAAGGLPLAYLLDEQPRVRARLIGSTVAFTVDFGAVVDIDWVALMETTIPAGATVALAASSTDDTGVTAEEGAASVTAAGTEATRGNVHIDTAGWSARYLRVTVSGLADGCDIGLMYAGPLWVLERGIGGLQEGRTILDGRDGNPISGAEFAVPALINPRILAGSLTFTRAEIAGAHRDMLAAIGGARDVLLIPNTADTQAELSARALWGAMQQPGGATVVQRVSVIGARSFVLRDRA